MLFNQQLIKGYIKQKNTIRHLYRITIKLLEYAYVSSHVGYTYIILFTNPIIDIQKTATALEMSYNTVAKVVSILIDDGILEQTDKSGKAKIYSYIEYLNILRKYT